MRLRRLLPALVLALGLGAAPAFQPEPEEQVFLDRIDHGRSPLEAKEAAKAYLAGHPDSFLAHEALGMYFLLHEGDKPRALYHLQRAKVLMERRYAPGWGPASPSGYYTAVLGFLYETQFQMERYQDCLATLRLRSRMMGRPLPHLEAWPLMKLGRYAECRARIEAAQALPELRSRINALNTLSALEAELDHPEAALPITQRVVDLSRSDGGTPDATYLCNLGEAHGSLGDLGAMERCYLEATTCFDPHSVSNPWDLLADLYLAEQRLPEALDAVRRMHQWAYRSSPEVAVDSWNRRQTRTAGLLYRCGYTDEALAITTRLADRPDRHARGSNRDGQRQAGTFLFHYQVLRDAQERDAEALSCAPWKRRPGLLMRAVRHRVQAALARRAAASLLMASGERFRHTLRGLAVQSVTRVPGAEVLLPDVVGSGVVEAEAQRLLGRSGAVADRERGFLLLSLGAARLERGEPRAALQALDLAAAALPAEVRVLRTQVQALRAKALLRLGGPGAALAPLQAVLAVDGGELRRLGVRLPCTVQGGGGSAAALAASLLNGSPRLQPGRGGFRVVVQAVPGGGLAGGLDSPQGTVLCRFQVPPGPDPDATARAFCQQFHHKAFGPRIDLSQQQIRSLEGSTLAVQGADELMRGLLGGSAPD